MKIVNFNGDKIQACFSFVVGNCEISVSTIFNKDRAEIAIFNDSNKDMLKDRLRSIGAAIAWVESFGPRD